MKFKLNWINQYVDLKDKAPAEIYDALNSMGLEIESFAPICQANNLVSGQVVKKEKHSNADKLNVCQVDLGTETTQIVCGAQNFKEGDFVIVAKPGAILPGNIKIKASEIRGEASNGMICALRELGYPQELLSQEANTGIHVIPQEITTGREDVLTFLGLDDYQVEIGITPNRADWHSVYEIAKELAVYFQMPLKELTESDIDFIQDPSLIQNNAANKIAFLEINDIKAKQLDDEQIQNLAFSGVNSVSPIVDLGNILFLETGQPNHLYDASKIKGLIKVTNGFKGKFVALDDKEYSYDENDLVIVDDSGVIALAGVIGSKSTMVDEKTTNAILEVGNFDGTTIRKSSNKINLFTTAAMRFSKGISIDTIKTTVKRAKYLFEQQFQASFGKCRIAGQPDVGPTVIDFDFKMVNEYLGFDIDKKSTTAIFERLGFSVDGNQITIPAYRVDITIPADLIEEVARVYGYEKLEARFSPAIPTLIPNEPEFDFVNNVKANMVSQGLTEVITYSLVSPSAAKDFALVESDNLATLSKPLSSERATMRLSGVNSLIEVAKNNLDRGVKNINIFEVTKINNLDSSSNELIILQYGNIVEDTLYNDVKQASYTSLHTTLRKLMRSLNIIDTRYQLKPMAENKFFNHFNAANIYIGQELIGRFGQVHPAIAKKHKLQDVFVLQLNIDIVMQQKVAATKVKELSVFPSVVQDYTIDVAKDTYVNDLIMLAKRSSKLISSVSITSIYIGDKIDDSLKAVTLKIEYNNSQETIKDNQIQEFRNSFIKLCNESGFTIRG